MQGCVIQSVPTPVMVWMTCSLSLRHLSALSPVGGTGGSVLGGLGDVPLLKEVHHRKRAFRA